MSKLTLVASITAKEGKVELLKSKLVELMAPTKAEKGCVNYHLHQDNENPAHFLFYENWESRELWQDHMESDHIKGFMATSDELVEAVTITELAEIV